MPGAETTPTYEHDSHQLESPVAITERLLGQFTDASFAHDNDGIDLTLLSLADMLETYGDDMPVELKDRAITLLDLALER